MYKYLLNLITTFILPFLAFYSPLQHSLIALGIMVLINYILAVIVQFRAENGWFLKRLFYSLLNKNTFYKTLKIGFDYSLVILLIGLFEVYFLGIDVGEISSKLLSFSHFIVIYLAWKEVKRGFKLNEKVTGSVFYEELVDMMPEKVRSVLKL